MSEQLSIILVDDDPDEHAIMEMALSMIDKKCELISVYNHDEMVKALDKKVPTAIFVDINIPGINGFEILSWIVSDVRFIDLPTIIYSTSINTDHIDMCYKIGADLYFKKEKSLETLAKKLEKVLDHIETNVPFAKKDFENYSYFI